jgi:CO/xanthine dehydrogenase FAD-binding subunit
MIVEYHRPTTLEETLSLLERPQPLTRPLAGGTALVRPSGEPIAVVDLQALGLNTAAAQGNTLALGATLTLQQLLAWLAANPVAPADGLRAALLHEATYNLRQAATVAGTVVAATGRSPLATALLALDAGLNLLPGDESLGLGDVLPLRAARLRGRLITQVALPLNARLAYAYAARTPADRPIVCVAAARWPSGRIRVAVGGFGAAPLLAFDGTEPDGVEAAARNAFSEAGDQWASAEYRSATAAVLAARCLTELQS